MTWELVNVILWQGFSSPCKAHLRIYGQVELFFHVYTFTKISVFTVNVHCVVLSSEGEIRGDIIYLGNYQNDFDWDNATAKVSYVKQEFWLVFKCNLSCI